MDEQIICTVENGNIIFPEGFLPDESEMVLIPKSKNNLQLYTLSNFSKITEYLTDDETKISSPKLIQSLLSHSYVARVVDNIVFSKEFTDKYVTVTELTATKLEAVIELKMIDKNFIPDSETFDAQGFSEYVKGSKDNIDIKDVLEKVSPSTHNFNAIRNELINSVDIVEYFIWMVKNFDKEALLNDTELMTSVYKSFDKFFIDMLFDEPDSE